jgi:hypothetical protein
VNVTGKRAELIFKSIDNIITVFWNSFGDIDTAEDCFALVT